MFLTNNYRTINNLIVYSKGVYIPRIIPNCNINTEKYEYDWIKYLQTTKNNFLKRKTPNQDIDYTIKPYGNIGRKIYLETDNNGKALLYNWKGH